MAHFISIKNVFCFAVVGCLIIISTVLARADDQAKSAADDQVRQEDFYRLPAGGVPELLEFINQVASFNPETPGEQAAFQENAARAMKSAAQKIVQLEQDKTSEACRTAVDILVELLALEIPQAELSRQAELLDEMLAYVSGRTELSLHDVPQVMEVAEALEQSHPLLAARAYTQLSEMLVATKQERLVRIGEMLAGPIRRLQLVGQEMDVKGRTLDGAQFDLSNLKGKVVLVDFWATWCPPCLAEIPNMKALYAKYRGRGFEVVGISLDEDRAALEEFVKQREIPWPILNDGGNSGHSAVSYYGINAIPAMFLVGREGKVVSLNARGGELPRLLEEQFGSIETTRP